MVEEESGCTLQDPTREWLELYTMEAEPVRLTSVPLLTPEDESELESRHPQEI